MQGIQKELMVVGGISFLFKCVVDSAHFDGEWLHAIEFADIIIPIAAFFFCMLGTIAVYVFQREEVLVCDTFLHGIWELLNKYYRQKSTNVFTKLLFRSRMEFHASKVICFDEFDIIDETFPFDEYLMKVYEKYLMDIINIDPWNWLLVIFLAYCNWIRWELQWNIYPSCEDLACTHENDIILFTIVGFGMLACTLVLALVSRYYQLQYFRLFNAEANIADYLEKKAKEQDGMRDMMRLLGTDKKGDSTKKSRHKSFYGNAIIKSKDEFQKLSKTKADTMHNRWKQLYDVLSREDGLVYTPRMKSIFLFNSPALYFRTIESMVMVISFYLSLWICNFVQTNDFSDRDDWKFYSLLPALASIGLFVYIIRASAFTMAVTLKDSHIIDEVLEQKREVRQRAGYIRETILSNILEREEFKGNVEEYVQSISAVEARLIVLDMFNSIDPDRSSVLTRDELQIFFSSLGITFSARKWRRLFREIDKDGDNKINSEDMIMFLFYDHKEIQKSHKEEKDTIKKNVRRMSMHVKAGAETIARKAQFSKRVADERTTNRIVPAPEEEIMLHSVAKTVDQNFEQGTSMTDGAATKQNDEVIKVVDGLVTDYIQNV